MLYEIAEYKTQEPIRSSTVEWFVESSTDVVNANLSKNGVTTSGRRERGNGIPYQLLATGVSNANQVDVWYEV
ncbi:hypothetical protein PHLCEN_2v12174 [Hermanssonia centrifuga]|uniref:Uncharacterized protein n=1 Tax=Hermanssonia centrifuga TaxID=98765 RepID=A0A2R6NHV4_9APHY|nr:hypothetical protein PHLCEN_2v12174 [Hermanssonia centrifuga]